MQHEHGSVCLGTGGDSKNQVACSFFLCTSQGKEGYCRLPATETWCIIPGLPQLSVALRVCEERVGIDGYDGNRQSHFVGSMRKFLSSFSFILNL